MFFWLCPAETANWAESAKHQFGSEPSEILNLRSSTTPETSLYATLIPKLVKPLIYIFQPQKKNNFQETIRGNTVSVNNWWGLNHMFLYFPAALVCKLQNILTTCSTHVVLVYIFQGRDKKISSIFSCFVGTNLLSSCDTSKLGKISF